MFDSQDLLQMASRDYILGDISIKEQTEFIMEQIQDPFNSGHNNYFRKLQVMIKNDDTLDETCLKLFNAIENTYPDIEFDLSEYTQRLPDVFSPVYKFFIKNIEKMTILFIKQYLLNNKNRKNLTAEYINLKMPNYPKEQFGKKEFYILISKLSPIIKDISNSDISLNKFIDYIERDEKCPVYVSSLKKVIGSELMFDHGVVSNILSLFYDSDNYSGDLNMIEMILTNSLILPYLKDNGLEEIKLSPINPIDDEDDSEETEEDDEND